MSLKKENYVNRLVDKKVEDYLSVYGAILIEGPKWCGKTWTSLNNSNSKILLDDKETRQLAELDLNLVLEKDKP